MALDDEMQPGPDEMAGVADEEADIKHESPPWEIRREKTTSSQRAKGRRKEISVKIFW